MEEQIQSEATASPNPAPARPTQRLFIYGALAALAAATIIGAGLLAYRVYAKEGKDQATLKAASWLRLPAAKINGASILYADYIADLQAIEHLREYDRARGGAGATAALSDESLRDQVLLRLLSNAIVSQAAAERGLSPAADQVAKFRADLLKQFPSETVITDELKARYDWTLDTYTNKVIAPFVLQQQVAEKFQQDDSRRAPIKAQAETILAQIKDGGDFAALAAQYGQDSTAARGGDLGWFGRGEMVPVFEEAAFALKKGAVHPTLVESPYGYHIIRVDNKKTERQKDASGKMVNAPLVQARHILFRFPSFDEYVDKQLRAAKIKIYVRARNPIATLSPATSASTSTNSNP